MEKVNSIEAFCLTNKPGQTKKAGFLLAKEIIKQGPGRKALVLGLVGDLGGGKTTFLQGLAKGLGIEKKILSPTFVLMKKFKIPKKDFGFFYHLDCYRIEKPEEIAGLGFKEIISLPGNVVAVEWSDRIRKLLPPDSLILEFEFKDNKKRGIVLKYKDGR